MKLCTQHPLATTSNDYLHPWGARVDNFSNRRFNDKLYKLFPRGCFLRILDLGCGGGAFVGDCIEDGHEAVGIDGSDYSLKTGRGAWKHFPGRFFTADITKQFCGCARFDVITSFEVLEHISETDLPGVFENIQLNLIIGGLIICTVSDEDDMINGVQMHVTRRPKAWWIRQFEDHGFIYRPALVKYFNTQFVRGPKFGYSYKSFPLVFSMGAASARIPKFSITKRLLHWVYDRWAGSKPQRFLCASFQ